MRFAELLEKSRSYRRFDENHRIDRQTLVDLVALVRLCPSSSNRQSMKFLVACEPDERAKVFPHLIWAGALKDWPGPAEGERPTGYIILLGDTQVHPTFDVDPGIFAQSMLLGAAEQGLGGCMIAAVEREGLRRSLNIPEHFEIVLAIALGKPAEKVVLDEMTDPAAFAYWRDDDVHHVPKRPLRDLLVEF